MGHNYAGVNRKKRLARARKAEKRLDAWAKRVAETWSVKRDGIWAFIGEHRDHGPSLFYSATEPGEEQKVKLNLPSQMTFQEGLSYVEEHPDEFDATLRSLQV